MTSTQLNNRVDGSDLAHTALRGTFWAYASFYGGKVMVLISTIILARLLSTEDFGVAGYALTIIALVDVLRGLGVGYALIYHEDSLQVADTAFWLSLLVGMCLFLLTWLGAPLVGMFFNDERAIPVTQALALTFPIAALGNVHDMLLRKGLKFGRKFIPDLIQAISKGTISIGLALMGFGAWSLIWGQIGGVAIAVIAYWSVSTWRPSLRFVRGIARSLLSYGLSIVSGDALSIVVANVDYLFVGHFLGAVALGIYQLAFRIPELLILQFCDIVSRVLFPLYSILRENPDTLSEAFWNAARYMAIVTIPLGLGLVLVAEPLIITVFTDKWIKAVPVLRAIAIYALMLSLAYNAGDVYKAQGRPIILTWLALLHALLAVPALYWAAANIGTIVAVGLAHAIVASIMTLVNLLLSLYLLKSPVSKMVQALQPSIISGGVMSIAVIGILYATAFSPAFIQLISSISVGGLVYIGTLWFFERELILKTSNRLRASVINR